MGNAAEAVPEPNRLLRIRVSLNGRPVKSYVFDKETVIVGRDPDCDVVLDNVGVSRHHLKFELRPTGSYAVCDLESANGTLLNDQPLKQDFIYSGGDVIQIGKFTLAVTREADRRFLNDDRRPTPDAFARTRVLSTVVLQKVEREARQHRMATLIASPPQLQAVDAPAPQPPVARPRVRPVVLLTAIFLAGVAAGMLLERFLGN